MIKKLSDNYLTKYYAFFGFLTFFVILIILFSFYIIGNPSAQRDAREDENAQDRIYNLATRITDYYQSKGNLPQKIDVFFAAQDESDQKILTEIEKYKIDYQKLDGYNYKLCAEFKTSNYPICFTNGIKGECEITPVDYNYYQIEFLHRGGYQCNTYDVTQGSYPIKSIN